MAVAFKATTTDKKDLWKEGEIFKLLANRELLDTFVSYYKLRGLDGTVCGKTNHLIKLADEAIPYFLHKDQAVHDAIRSNISWLRRVSMTHKTLARHAKTAERDIDLRLAQFKHLSPDDFKKLWKKASSALSGIMRKVNGTDGIAFRSLAFENFDLVKKWCLNFLSLLIFKGGGQRPQLYGLIACPSASELAGMKDQCEESGYFTLQTGVEKVRRPSWAPKFVLPGMVYKFLEFHVTTVLPHLRGERPQPDRTTCDALILDTRTGRNISAHNVTPSLRSFIKDVDREIGRHITTMDIRANYATIALRSFIERSKRQNYDGPTRDEYIRDLAAVMNTSTEMLNTVYLGIDDGAYTQAARRVFSVICGEEGNDEDESEEEEEEGDSWVIDNAFGADCD